MEGIIKWHHEIGPADLGDVGGKAAHLGVLSRARVVKDPGMPREVEVEGKSHMR